MPVVQGHQAASLLKEAVVLDLSDVSRQADRIIESARQRSQEMIAAARAEAERLTAKAHEEGFTAGHAQGVEKGVEEGLEQGRQSAIDQCAQESQAMQQGWAHALQTWEGHHQQVHRDSTDAVLEVALRLTEKIIHRVIEIDDSVILDQVRNALGYVLSPLDVTVAINAADRDLLEAAMPGLMREFSHLGHVKLENDEAVGRGGCVVNYGTGRIDATLATQLTRIVERMFPADVQVEPSAVHPALAPLEEESTDADAEHAADAADLSAAAAEHEARTPDSADQAPAGDSSPDETAIADYSEILDDTDDADAPAIEMLEPQEQADASVDDSAADQREEPSE